MKMSWHRQRMLQVKEGNFSSAFTVTNGVRQSGYLSPYLLAVYIYEL